MNMLRLRIALSRIRRHLFEALGSARYSRPAFHALDRKLEKYLNYENGFFIEAGANDGYTQSNTYYYEKFRGWSGVLVEGIPALYERCVKERKRSRVFNYALVPHDFEGDTVTMHYANLFSLTQGARKSPDHEQDHINTWINLEKDVTSYTVEVPVKTLTALLDEAQVTRIDLLSLDVEGYELQVLRGLDLNKYRPIYILVEANYPDEIEAYLTAFDYEAIDKLSHHDVLYRSRRDP